MRRSAGKRVDCAETLNYLTINMAHFIEQITILSTRDPRFDDEKTGTDEPRVLLLVHKIVQV